LTGKPLAFGSRQHEIFMLLATGIATVRRREGLSALNIVGVTRDDEISPETLFNWETIGCPALAAGADCINVLTLRNLLP
jgi:hypothetical protein